MAGRALVTGAGRRLGRAMALCLGGRGYDVAVHYSASRAEAEAVAAEIRAMGRRAEALGADLLDEGQTEALGPATRPSRCRTRAASRWRRRWSST